MKLNYFQVIHKAIIYIIMKIYFGGKIYND